MREFLLFVFNASPHSISSSILVQRRVCRLKRVFVLESGGKSLVRYSDPIIEMQPTHISVTRMLYLKYLYWCIVMCVPVYIYIGIGVSVVYSSLPSLGGSAAIHLSILMPHDAFSFLSFFLTYANPYITIPTHIHTDHRLWLAGDIIRRRDEDGLSNATAPIDCLPASGAGAASLWQQQPCRVLLTKKGEEGSGSRECTITVLLLL